MADVFSTEQRSRIMSNVRNKDTEPERVVRSLLHRMGYRFRLQRRDLPGKPDIVLPRYRIAIFVHGCFWHRHEGCRRASTPATRTDFWETKFAANRERDAAAATALADLGWRVVVIWECTTRNGRVLERLLRSILGRDTGAAGGEVDGEAIQNGDVDPNRQ